MRTRRIAEREHAEEKKDSVIFTDGSAKDVKAAGPECAVIPEDDPRYL
ncbi:MAG: hypothetical protein FWG58_02870 [Methanomassiliicoccaceae archaeon]|nr:hypothetical protein [Methanomassiliicoccaceae archaeon]